MKKLVIYDSAFGNTKKVAEAIADGISGEAVNVKDVQAPDLHKASLIIVGSPINGWQPLPSISKFLNLLNDLNGISATTFDTRVKLFIHGDAKGKMAKALKNAGAKIITEPMAFYVKGTEGPLFEEEIEKAKNWSKVILNATQS